MPDMLRIIGYGDNAGSGFPTILSVWKQQGWEEPDLEENFELNQVTLTLTFKKAEKLEKKLEFEEQKLEFATMLEKYQLNEPTKEKAKLLFALFGYDHSFGVKEIKSILNLPESTAFNLEKNLKNHQIIVETNQRGKYCFAKKGE